ncbi:hypothetical protein [Lichenibacterium dinghuense]|uniref:hypothetical protein n=1 Tax=Lichenibacterium dinghuense TaxID=2895977 RepID=UPI001F46FE5B|nr:hypothetical protein [Lichenibacterium sp. 6Y81]
MTDNEEAPERQRPRMFRDAKGILRRVPDDAPPGTGLTFADIQAEQRDARSRPEPFLRRRQIMDLVIDDQQRPPLKPFDAELQIEAELGPVLGNFASFITEADATALRNDAWPWQVACCWIMTQDPRSALLAVASFAVWQGCTVRDACRPGHLMSFAQASAVLRRALIRGEVRARRDDGALAQEIPAVEWARLSWKTVDGETRCFDELRRDGVPAYENPVIVAADVLRWKWTLDGLKLHFSESIEQEPAPAIATGFRSRGRPPGSGSFAKQDAPLISEALQRINGGEPRKTVLEAVGRRAAGSGSVESRSKRIERGMRKGEDRNCR